MVSEIKFFFWKIDFHGFKRQNLVTKSRNQASRHSGRGWEAKMAKKGEKFCFSSKFELF